MLSYGTPLKLEYFRNNENELVWFPIAIYQCNPIVLLKQTDRQGNVTYRTTWSIDVYPNMFLHDRLQEETSRMVKHVDKIDLTAACVYGGCSFNENKQVILPTNTLNTKEAILAELGKRVLIDPAHVTYEQVSDVEAKITALNTSLFIKGEVSFSIAETQVPMANPWFTLLNLEWQPPSVEYVDQGFMYSGMSSMGDIEISLSRLKPADGTVVDFDIPANPKQMLLFAFDQLSPEAVINSQTPLATSITYMPQQVYMLKLGSNGMSMLDPTTGYHVTATFTTKTIQLSIKNLTTQEVTDHPVQSLASVAGAEGILEVVTISTDPAVKPVLLENFIVSGTPPILLESTDNLTDPNWARLHSATYDQTTHLLTQTTPNTLFDYGNYHGLTAAKKMTAGKTYRVKLLKQTAAVKQGVIVSGFDDYATVAVWEQQGLGFILDEAGNLAPSTRNTTTSILQGLPYPSDGQITLELTQVSPKHYKVVTYGNDGVKATNWGLISGKGIDVSRTYLIPFGYNTSLTDSTPQPPIYVETLDTTTPTISLIDSSAITWGAKSKITASAGSLQVNTPTATDLTAFISGTFKYGQSITIPLPVLDANHRLDISIQPQDSDINLNGNSSHFGIHTGEDGTLYAVTSEGAASTIGTVTAAGQKRLKITHMTNRHFEVELTDTTDPSKSVVVFIENPFEVDGVTLPLQLTGNDYIAIRVTGTTNQDINGLVIPYT